MLNTKTIQCAPTSAYSSRFITYAPFFVVLCKLSLLYTPLKCLFLKKYSLISKFVKGCGGIRAFFLIPSPALKNPFPAFTVFFPDLTPFPDKFFVNRSPCA